MAKGNYYSTFPKNTWQLTNNYENISVKSHNRLRSEAFNIFRFLLVFNIFSVFIRRPKTPEDSHSNDSKRKFKMPLRSQIPWHAWLQQNDSSSHLVMASRWSTCWGPFSISPSHFFEEKILLLLCFHENKSSKMKLKEINRVSFSVWCLSVAWGVANCPKEARDAMQQFVALVRLINVR